MDITAFLSWDGGIFGLVVGIIGLAAAWWSISRRSLTYASESVPLIGISGANFPASVEVTFAREPVPNLLRTGVYIWSTGNIEIREDDIAKGDPLRLALSGGGRILDVRVARASNPVNQFEVGPLTDSGDATIRFEFLNPKEGARVEILHTAAGLNVELRGTMKGARSSIKRSTATVVTTRDLRVVFCLVFGLLVVTNSLYLVSNLPLKRVLVMVIAVLMTLLVVRGNAAQVMLAVPRALRLDEHAPKASAKEAAAALGHSAATPHQLPPTSS